MNIVEFKRRRANEPRAADEAGTSAITAAHDEDARERMRKYDNSQKLPLKVRLNKPSTINSLCTVQQNMRDKKLKMQLSRAFVHAKESATEAARTELLLPDEAG
jgi:hypothetical protein